MIVFTDHDFEHRALVLLVALLLDSVFGEPDWIWQRLPHPVVIFGKIIGTATRLANKRHYKGKVRRMLGAISVVILLSLSGLAGAAFEVMGTPAQIVLLTILLAGHSLDQHVRAVATGLKQGLKAGRNAVGMIVGRQTDQMSQDEISRAAIETAAENLSDGVIAPAFWFLIGGLPGLLIYKMTNTADSMIGYKDANFFAFGWTAARFDDVLNYLPARLTALMIAVASMGSSGGIGGSLGCVLVDAKNHPSPNAGWPECAMAGGLDIWLGGPRRYGNRKTNASFMNSTGASTSPSDIYSCLRINMIATGLFLIIVLYLALPAIIRLVNLSML